MLGNLDPEAPELTKHFMAASFLKDGHWFHLARYHDPDVVSGTGTEFFKHYEDDANIIKY